MIDVLGKIISDYLDKRKVSETIDYLKLIKTYEVKINEKFITIQKEWEDRGDRIDSSHKIIRVLNNKREEADLTKEEKEELSEYVMENLKMG